VYRSGTAFTVMEAHHRSVNLRGESIWSNRMMVNEWTLTRSAPSAVLFGTEIAWAWRMNEYFEGLENRVELSLTSSGTTDRGLSDFDDVSWIAEHGLRESLWSVDR
jgi:hypothetical protein